MPDSNQPTDFTAELAERTVLVRWPDNERRGATPPAADWQHRAWAQETTLHEIDEGSITGCSVLRWRNDPRTDAELVAVSLALVSGAPQPAASPSAVVSADRATLLRKAIDVAREEGHRLEAEQGIEAARGARSVAYLLRKLLVKAQPVDWAVVAYRSPGTRTLYCVICARQETGWLPLTADKVREGAVCDFCGGRVLALASRTLGDVVARYIPAAEEQPAETQDVRALHVPDENGECQHCHHSYDPCPTIRALVGEQPDTQTREADRG